MVLIWWKFEEEIKLASFVITQQFTQQHVHKNYYISLHNLVMTNKWKEHWAQG